MRLESGQVDKDPNREVQDRIALVFQTLLEQKTLSKVVRHLRDHRLKIPRRDKWGDIHWKLATVWMVSEMVSNPAYAGAYVRGRTRCVKSKKTGRKQQVALPREQWQVCLRDKYPAYISWDEFERIAAMLKDNYAEYKRNQTRGVPREGKALLQGIAYCGECGHKLVVQYKHGTQYLCSFLKVQAKEPQCQRLPADALDDQVVRWFFEALSAAEIDASAHVLVEGDQARDRVLAARRQEVERLRYQARLADRQFQRSDPDNRLVTAELERRWEEALRACQESEDRLREEEAHAPCLAIPADLLEQLQNVGPLLPKLWEEKLLKTSQKKALLRTLIDKVVLQRIATDRVRRASCGAAARPRRLNCAYLSAVSLACPTGSKSKRRSSVLHAKDKPTSRSPPPWQPTGIAHPCGDEIGAAAVCKIRLAHRILRYPKKSQKCRKAGYLTLSQLADKLNVAYTKIYRLIVEEKLNAKKDGKCYLFPDKPATLAQVRQLLEGKISRLDF